MAKPVLGARYILTKPVDRLNLVAPAYTTGTVVKLEPEFIALQAEQPIPGTEPWNNSIEFYTGDAAPVDKNGKPVPAEVQFDQVTERLRPEILIIGTLRGPSFETPVLEHINGEIEVSSTMHKDETTFLLSIDAGRKDGITFERTLKRPYDEWSDGRNMDGIDEELLYAAREVVQKWGQPVEGFYIIDAADIDAAIRRLKQALVPFEGVMEESEEEEVE